MSVCEYATVGVWNQTDEGIDIEFMVTKNLRRATLKVSGPGVEGRFFIDSITPPRYPHGEKYPSPTADLALAPLIYWNEATPAGTVRANFM